MEAIKNSEGGQELTDAWKEIHTSELRQATLSLGLKLANFDLQWDTFVSQYNLSVQRLQAENWDTTPFVLLHNMLEHLRTDVATIKNATYLALTDSLNGKDHEEFLKRQKRRKNQAQASARNKRKKENEPDEKEMKLADNV